MKLMSAIIDDFWIIRYELECSEEKIKHFNFYSADDKLYCIDVFTSISDDIELHWNDIKQFCKQYNYSCSGWCELYKNKCLCFIEAIIIDLKNPEITDEIKEAITLNLLGAITYWNDKYEDDFEIWYHSLCSHGLKFCKETFIYAEENIKEAFLKMMQNALHAETTYFSLSRNKNKATIILKNSFFGARQTSNKPQPIDLQQHSGRSIITADTAAVAESLVGIDTAKFDSDEVIAKQTGWHKGKKMNWNRLKVTRGYLPNKKNKKQIEINYQFQPKQNQLGNVMVNGVGRYGEAEKTGTPNILTIFNKLTLKQPDKEQGLARLLLKYKCGDGWAICEESLNQHQMVLPTSFTARKTLIAQFNRAAYLICFLEVSRRKNQGYDKNDEIPVVELPFGLAVACTLKLIADGHLSFKEALTEDALYGVFTSKSVMNANLYNTIKKFSVLFTFFSKKYASEIYEVFDLTSSNEDYENANIAFTSEYFHQILRQTDGGKDDSDNEEYNSGNEKDCNIKVLAEHLKNIDLSDDTSLDSTISSESIQQSALVDNHSHSSQEIVPNGKEETQESRETYNKMSPN